MSELLRVQDLPSRVQTEIGLSSWQTITQAQIDDFARATGDHQFIHVDPIRAAAETPYGGTIAHGFLTLSLLSAMSMEVLPLFAGTVSLNYGFDKLRFVSPVKTGARVRGRFILSDFSARSEQEFLLRYAATIEIEHGSKPALVADWLTLTLVQGAQA